MVVDDSSEVRAALRALLDGQDVEVVAETADPDEAVDLVATTKPDAVLLDWVFGGSARGALALASLRRWVPEVPVVVYTAYPEAARRDAAQMGAAYVATKEIAQSRDLARVIEKVIEEWAAGGTSEHPSRAGAPGGREGTEGRARRERARARLSCPPREPDG